MICNLVRTHIWVADTVLCIINLCLFPCCKLVIYLIYCLASSGAHIKIFYSDGDGCSFSFFIIMIIIMIMVIIIIIIWIWNRSSS